jgi:hypothetical protein
MNLKLPVLFLSFLLLSMILFFKPYDTGLMAAGFVGASAEIILLVAFQALAGYAFSQSGLFIALFMAGMFAGSYWLARYFSASYKSFTTNLMIQLGLLLLMTGYLFMAGKGFFTEGWATYIFLIAIAASTGLQFAICVKMKKTSPVKNAGISYSLDLLGSGIGIFLLTVFVIPYFGLTGSILLLAGFNVLIITSIAIKSLWMKNNR